MEWWWQLHVCGMAGCVCCLWSGVGGWCACVGGEGRGVNWEEGRGGGGGVAATFTDSAMAKVCHTVWREGGRKGGREEMQQAIYALCFCCPCGLAAAQRESHYNAGCPCSWPCAHHGCACAALSTDSTGRSSRYYYYSAVIISILRRDSRTTTQNSRDTGVQHMMMML